jgi:hypothetical protein
MRRKIALILAVLGVVCAAQPGSTLAPHAGGNWDLMILDANRGSELGSTAVGDIDGDGRMEVVIGGATELMWYRPKTFEKGVIARGHFHCGVAINDIYGDGIKEVVAGREIVKDGKPTDRYALYWFKPGKDLREPWTEHVIDPGPQGGPHDVLFADLDGDGKPELIANAMYSGTPALYAYKPGASPSDPWKKQIIQTGLSAEGTAAGDLEGNGKMDIVFGPYWFSPPAAGPFSGQPWKQNVVAAGFRELCRVALIDVNGDGRLDVVMDEDEFPDGHLSWFENRVGVDAQHPWVEHRIDERLNFPHTLQAWREGKTGAVNVFTAEMNAGGWDAPYNYDARLLKYVLTDHGRSVQRELLYQGEGTHEAIMADLDGDGVPEIVGQAAQVVNKDSNIGWVQIWKQRPAQSPPSPLLSYHHQFLDREKPYTGTDILAVDVDGDGLPDVVCGAWWYKNPTWERYEIPGVHEILNAYDIDGDGRKELIGIKKKPGAGTDGFYSGLTSELYWLKPIDPAHGRWEEHRIGTGSGDWPHGTLIAPLLPGGKLALVAGYHDGTHPEIFEAPADLTKPWPRRVLAEIRYGEEMAAYDLDGDGRLDIVAGPYWLENLGNGQFEPHLLAEGFGKVARMAIADINGDGKPDIVVSEEDLSYQTRQSYLARVAWLENTGDPRHKKFIPHVIDNIRCPHSVSVTDLEGDGQLEVIAAEHDPFKPYRSRCRLFAYKKADPKGTAWYRYTLDDRFEQHDGAKIIELAPGKLGIIGHGWAEDKYVHLWTTDAAK